MNKTIEIKKYKNEWTNVTYVIDNPNNESDPQTMIEDNDSEDEYTNTVELITMEDIENSDSD